MLTVNGEQVADSLLREEAATLRPKYYEVMGSGDPIALEMQLREWSRENVIERVLLKQEAVRRNISIEELIRTVQSAVPKPKPKEVTQLYTNQQDTFWKPEMVHVAHIVKNIDETHTEEHAMSVMELAQTDLARGVLFATVADQYSDCPGNGGDLGWFPQGQMVPEFDAVVFGLRVGETSPVFRTPFGLHIANLKGRKPEGIPALADVREHLESQIFSVKQQQAIEVFVDQLRAGATVTL